MATSLSVAVMIISVAIISGFNKTITGKLFSFEGNVHIYEYRNNIFKVASVPPVQIDEGLIKSIAAMPHVTHVGPYVKRQGILQYKGAMEGLMLKGIDADFRLSGNIQFTGEKIDYVDSAYSKDIILSEYTANRLNIKPGESLQVYFMEEGSTLPRIRKVRVAGLYHTGMDEVDKFFGLCDIRLLQRINNWEPYHISGYQVDVDDDKFSPQIQEKADDLLTAPLYAYTMQQIYSSTFTWLDLTSMNGSIILIIMSIVAVINLAAALLILIVEQARMVGILKAQGLTAGAMRWVFLYYAGLISGVGIMVGNIIALTLGWVQASTGFIKLSEASYYMNTVPVNMVWWHVALIDIATLVVCILCMWLPTLYIRRIQPARVLQFK